MYNNSVRGSHQLYNDNERVIPTVKRLCEGHNKCTTTVVGSYQLYNESGRVTPIVQRQW